MTQDIRRYRNLLEAAMTVEPGSNMDSDLERDAADTAELLVHVLHGAGKEKNMDRMIHDSLKTLHGETYAHHNWKKFGQAVLRHAHAMIQAKKS